MTHFIFDPVGESYLLVVVAALILLGLLLIRPASSRASRWRQAVLVGLRVAVIVLMIVIMLRPTIVYTQTKKQSAALVVMIDGTGSMTVADALGGKTRWEALKDAVADAESALADLAEDFQLKAYVFDAQTHPAEVKGGKIILPDTPEGKETALGFSLEEVLQQEGGNRLLGIILLSDGRQRARSPRDKPPQTAAADMKRQGTPLYTFPCGESRGRGQSKDLWVKELLVNKDVFVKNELTIKGQVRIDGYLGEEIPVRVLFETAPGKMDVVAQTTVQATANGQVLPVTLYYAPQAPGEYKLTLEAVKQPGEVTVNNNRSSTFVNVRKGGVNVLYLEGALRVEQKFIRRALDGSPDIHVDYVRIDPRRPETRPGNLAERFKPGKYEVYILGDLGAKLFQGDELKNLAATVERGAGLIMLGGFHSFGPGGYADTPLEKVLPVDVDRLENQEFDQPIRKDVHVAGPLRMQPTQFGLLHFTMMLSSDKQQNMATWVRLPPLDGANKFTGAKPGALPLAVAETPARQVPLLVAHNYGNGRVLAFAGDSTWRWWMRGFDKAHKRFWRQVILWLAKKDQLGDGAVWIRLEQRKYAPGEQVKFVIGAQSSTGDPVPDAKYTVQLVGADGTRRPLKRLVREEDIVRGSSRETLPPGDYAIEVAADHEGMSLGTARVRFIVLKQDLEMDNTAADTDVMRTLAARTGGESLAPEQLSELIERLAKKTDHLEVEQITKESLWDTWTMFFGLVALLGVEWFLRKRWGLV